MNKWWKFLLISIIVIGIGFRFVNIEHKLYWADEFYTSLRVSGHTSEDIDRLTEGQEIGIEDLQKIQKITPDKGITATWNALKTHPEHTPFYFLLARFWRAGLGDSVAVKRGLSAVLSLLTLPCMYWLCWELFSSSLASWFATALLAVSPLHLLYAQEARHYTLWVVMILLSSAALLRAIRTQTQPDWIIYSLTAALALYTSLFSILVCLSHGVYIVLLERFRLTRTVLAYGLASLAGICLFSPWLWVILTRIPEFQDSVTNTKSNVSFFFLSSQWILNLTRNFIDIQFSISDPFKLSFSDALPLGYFAIPVSVLTIYSAYFLVRKTSSRVYFFIFSLVGLTGGIFAISDLVEGGLRSITPRYLFPCYLGVHISIAYLLASKIRFETWKTKKIWSLVAMSLLAAGIFSDAVISQANTWWTKYSDYYNVEVAEVINKNSKSLLISDSVYRVLSFSYLLDPQVKIKLGSSGEDMGEISKNFDTIFVYNSHRKESQQFREELMAQYQVQLKPLYTGELSYRNRIISLWKFEEYERSQETSKKESLRVLPKE